MSTTSTVSDLTNITTTEAAEYGDWLLCDAMNCALGGLLEVSNWETAREMFSSADLPMNSYGVFGRHLAVNPRSDKGVALLNSINDLLVEYPVLDDSHYSALCYDRQIGDIEALAEDSTDALAIHRILFTNDELENITIKNVQEAEETLTAICKRAVL